MLLCEERAPVLKVSLLWMSVYFAVCVIYVLPASILTAIFVVNLICFQCFDAVGWAAGRAYGM